MSYALVVDDSRVVRKFVRQLLEKLDFEVHEAADGRDALDKCRARMPDLILLDWNMPNMDGISFLKALRSQPDGRVPRVVFCTTENSFDGIARAMEFGADEYIMKPFDQAILQTKLEDIGAV